MRNVFVGGPNDGQVHLTFDLLTDDTTRNSIPWEEYYNKGEAEPAVDGEIPVMYWYHLGDAVVPSDGPAPSAPAAATAEAGEVPVAPEPTSSKPQKSEMRVRREALKIKRQELADMLDGMTIGVLARVESKGGTDDEVALIEAKLDELEADRG